MIGERPYKMKLRALTWAFFETKRIIIDFVFTSRTNKDKNKKIRSNQLQQIGAKHGRYQYLSTLSRIWSNAICCSRKLVLKVISFLRNSIRNLPFLTRHALGVRFNVILLPRMTRKLHPSEKKYTLEPFRLLDRLITICQNLLPINSPIRALFFLEHKDHRLRHTPTQVLPNNGWGLSSFILMTTVWWQR